MVIVAVDVFITLKLHDLSTSRPFCRNGSQNTETVESSVKRHADGWNTCFFALQESVEDYIVQNKRVVFFQELTGRGLDGSGNRISEERDFPHPFRPASGPTQCPVQWVPGHSRV